jgi:hypothetical protein
MMLAISTQFAQIFQAAQCNTFLAVEGNIFLWPRGSLLLLCWDSIVIHFLGLRRPKSKSASSLGDPETTFNLSDANTAEQEAKLHKVADEFTQTMLNFDALVEAVQSEQYSSVVSRALEEKSDSILQLDKEEVDYMKGRRTIVRNRSELRGGGGYRPFAQKRGTPTHSSEALIRKKSTNISEKGQKSRKTQIFSKK